MKPKYSIPVHGEYRHLITQGELAVSVGVDKDNVCILSSGDVLEIGQMVDAKITAIDEEKKNVSLSIRELLEEAKALEEAMPEDAETAEAVEEAAEAVEETPDAE